MRKRALIATAGVCLLGGALASTAQLENGSVDLRAPLNHQVVVVRQQCLQGAQDSALAALRAREESTQREWCEATRDARRAEFAAAFVESIRQASDGGDGEAKDVAAFLRKTPDAIKPLAGSIPECADEKLRIDEKVLEPFVNDPSLAGILFGVRIRGKTVSRFNPVPRWDRLKRNGLVLLSTQMTYGLPLPRVQQTEKAMAIQEAQSSECPTSIELDRVLALEAAAPVQDSALASTERDAADFVAAMMGDAYQRQHLLPLVQIAQSSARLPGLSDSCASNLQTLLTEEQLERRVALELTRSVNSQSLQRIVEVRRATQTPLFSRDGQMRLLHLDDKMEQARIEAIYGQGNRAAFMVDAASVMVAANQALAEGLHGWSSARSDLIALGCVADRGR